MFYLVFICVFNCRLLQNYIPFLFHCCSYFSVKTTWIACVAGGIRGHKRTGSLKYRLPKNYTFWVPPAERMVPPILMYLSNSFTYCTSANIRLWRFISSVYWMLWRQKYHVRFSVTICPTSFIYSDSFSRCQHYSDLWALKVKRVRMIWSKTPHESEHEWSGTNGTRVNTSEHEWSRMEHEWIHNILGRWRTRALCTRLYK
jgi:hypothetical protein